MGIGLFAPALALEYSVSSFFSKPIEVGLIAFIEELLKWALSNILFRSGASAATPMAVAAGFATSELLDFVYNGVPFSVRIGAFFFHMFTGIVLWLVIRRGHVWVGAVLIINTLLHWWWNLVSISP